MHKVLPESGGKPHMPIAIRMAMNAFLCRPRVDSVASSWDSSFWMFLQGTLCCLPCYCSLVAKPFFCAYQLQDTLHQKSLRKLSTGGLYVQNRLPTPGFAGEKETGLLLGGALDC